MTPAPPVRGPQCPPAVELEAFAAGEPRPFAAHVESCDDCGPYVAALKAEAEAFARARPPELFQKQLERRALSSPARPWWTRWWVVLTPVAAALALFLVPTGVPGPGDDGVTLKGSALRVFVKRGDAEPTPLAADARVAAGDALRFSYDAPQDGYLAIFDLDGTEAVTVFWPFDGTAASAVKRGAGLLPGSVVLDASPGPEWLVAVWSRAPFDVAPLAAQLRGQATRPAITLDCGDCVVASQRLSRR
jgi:hypothetical protein